MQPSAILTPFFGMMLLTLLVWVYMYTLRLHYFYANRVDPQAFATRAKAIGVGPDRVQNPSNNLQNLFELPVLFYALCLYLYTTGRVDAAQVTAAYAFLGFRAVHSAIHCTVNIVLWRFLAYAAAAIALWIMLIRAVLAHGAGSLT